MLHCAFSSPAGEDWLHTCQVQARLHWTYREELLVMQRWAFTAWVEAKCGFEWGLVVSCILYCTLLLTLCQHADPRHAQAGLPRAAGCCTLQRR